MFRDKGIITEDAWRFNSYMCEECFVTRSFSLLQNLLSFNSYMRRECFGYFDGDSGQSAAVSTHICAGNVSNLADDDGGTGKMFQLIYARGMFPCPRSNVVFCLWFQLIYVQGMFHLARVRPR